MIGNTALTAGPGPSLQRVDEVDDIEEAATRAIASIGNEGAAGMITDQAVVDRCAGEVEFLNVPGQRQLGDGKLVFDGARRGNPPVFGE